MFDDIMELMCGQVYDFTFADEEEYVYNPDEEDRRKDYLENYAAEAMGLCDDDELPL